MEKKSLDFDATDIIKSKFDKDIQSIIIDKVEIKRIILSKKESYGNKGSYKYYIEHRFKGCNMLSPLYIKLPQMNAYAKYFDKNSKYIIFLVNDEKIFKKIQ